MKVCAIATIRVGKFPNILWVHVETEEGITGLGETFYGPEAASSHIHQIIAPYLIGQDPRNIARHQPHLGGYLGYTGSSAEVRGRSAVDIALWDILGKSLGLPLCDVLGGRVRNAIKVYNTCAGPNYVQRRPTQSTANFGLDGRSGGYEDLHGFLHSADELAQSLLAMQISAMKIWPFDFAAEASTGQYISREDLHKALQPFEKIRRAVGDKMEIMAELHALWNRPSAIRIARALEPVEPLWIEDPVLMDHLASIAEVAGATRCPIAVGETRGMRADYRYLLELNALALLIMDLSWCGGISEARNIAASAETFHVPVAFHDCSGPVVLTASTHMALHVRNCFIQEIVRAFYYGWYAQLLTSLPPISNGHIAVPTGPGLGVELRADVLSRDDCMIRRTTAQDL